MVDELLYSELAKSFAERGELLIRELPVRPSQPALSGRDRARLARGRDGDDLRPREDDECGRDEPRRRPRVPLGAPARLARRSPSSRRRSCCCCRRFVYTGTLMTENAFFPAFVLAAYAFALALERPTLATQALALAAAAARDGRARPGGRPFAILVLGGRPQGAARPARPAAGPLRGRVRPYLPCWARSPCSASATSPSSSRRAPTSRRGSARIAGVTTAGVLGDGRARAGPASRRRAGPRSSAFSARRAHRPRRARGRSRASDRGGARVRGGRGRRRSSSSCPGRRSTRRASRCGSRSGT